MHRRGEPAHFRARRETLSARLRDRRLACRPPTGENAQHGQGVSRRPPPRRGDRTRTPRGRKCTRRRRSHRAASAPMRQARFKARSARTWRKSATLRWSVTVDDIAALRAAGYSEDAILELTIAAAAGAAGRRYDAAVTRCAARRDVRLTVLESGHRLRARLFLAFARRVAGGAEVDDVFKTILYRPELSGGLRGRVCSDRRYGVRRSGQRANVSCSPPRPRRRTGAASAPISTAALPHSRWDRKLRRSSSRSVRRTCSGPRSQRCWS